MFEFITSLGNFPGLQDMLLNVFTAIGDNGSIIAQVGLAPYIENVLTIFRYIAALLAVIGLTYSGYQFSQGNIAAAGYGIIGVAIIALAVVIVSSMFGISDPGGGGTLIIEV